MSGVFQIKQYENPHIGKLIKALREHRKISQETLARDAYFNRTTLSQIELGNQACPDELLLAIKAALKVEDLPLRDIERVEFREELYKWHGVISERKLDEAQELREKLSIIKLLPEDKELNILFSLFECKLLLSLNDLDASKKILDAFVIEELRDIQLYHYYYNQGTFCIRSKHNQEALDFYLKAYDLMKCGLEKNIALYYSIAISYERLGLVTQAITFLEEACMIQSTGHGSIPEFHSYSFLGANYTGTGHLQRAKYMLDRAHAIAINDYNSNVAAGTKANLGLVHLNYGFLFRMARKLRRAIEHLDTALMHLDIDDVNYLEALYQKTRCFMEMGNLSSCMDLLVHGHKLSIYNKVYRLMFEAIRLMLDNNDESAKKLETHILPYMLENNFVYPALDYAMFLRDYYKTKGRGFKTRSLEMSDVVCTVLNLMHEGGVIE